MSSKPVTHRSSRLSLALRLSGIVLVTAATVLLALYAATPFLVARLAPQFAGRIGLNSLEVEIGHPGLRGVDIVHLALTSDEFVVTGKDARMDYTPSALLEGRIDSLDFAEVEVLLPSAPAAAGGEASQTAGQLIPASPFQRLHAAKLTVKFPDTGFVGIGRAELGGGRLAFSMDGIEPEIASHFTVTANVSNEGVFGARFGERGDGADFIVVDGSLSKDSMTVAGNFTLTGYPLKLASTLTRLPPGAGAVAGEFETTLPWPLPDPFAWQDIAATVPAFSVDWKSEDDALELNAISGSATLQHGEVAATGSGSLRYRSDEREFTAHVPAGYGFGYRQGTLTGAAGLRLGMQEIGANATATMRSFALSLDPHTRLDADADIEASIDNVRAAGRLTGSLIDDALNVEGNLDVRSGPPNQAGGRIRLPAGAGKLAAHIETRLPSPLPATFAWQEHSATIPSFAIDWKSAKKDLDLEAVSGSAIFERGDIDASVSGTVRGVSDGRTLSARLPKNYQLSYRKDTLKAGPGLRLRLKDASTDATATVRSAALATTPKTRLDLDADVAAKLDTTGTTGRLKARVTLDDAKGERMTGRLDYAGTLEAPDQRRDGSIGADFSRRGNAVAANGTFSSGLFDKVPFTLSHNLKSGAGKFEANHVLKINRGLAAALIQDWEEVYDLDSGKIDATLAVDWRTPGTVTAGLALTVAGGTAHYEEYLASGIAGRLDLHADGGFDKENWRLEPALLTIKRVEIGIPVDDMTFVLAWSGDRVDFTEARATLLGGTATAPPFAYDIPTGSAAFDLTLTGLDLAAVLAVEGDDVIGTGTLDGTLPVLINDDQPRIVGGVVTARPPGGAIRLTPALAGAGGRPELTFALAALQDFTYSSLDARIDYAENGDLVLGIGLKGRNPAVEKGRPIHYNLNITENVPVLLESLRLQDKVTERIENKVKK